MDSSDRIHHLRGKLHLVENGQLQQFYDAARIYEHLVHIKGINIKGEYKCIVMGHNYTIGVYRGKGYRVVYKLGFFPATAYVDNVHSGFDRGYFKELLLFAFLLVLIVKRPFQYIVYS